MAGYEAPINPKQLGPQWELFAQITGKALTRSFVEGVHYEAEYADYIQPGNYHDAEILTLARAASVAAYETARPPIARTGPGRYKAM